MKLTTPPVQGNFHQFCEGTNHLPGKGWVNLDTGEIEKVFGGTHGDEVFDDPEKFGVEDEVEKIKNEYEDEGEEDEDDASCTQECLYAAIETGKWARFEDFMGEVNLEANTLPLAYKALKMMDKAGYYIYPRRGIRVEGYSDNQRVHLEDVEAIDFFLRHGKAKRKRF